MISVGIICDVFCDSFIQVSLFGNVLQDPQKKVVIVFLLQAVWCACPELPFLSCEMTTQKNVFCELSAY